MRLCPLQALPDNESRGFDPLNEGRDTLFVVRQAERLHAWRNVCPHLGAPLAWRPHAYLNAARDRIVCSVHGAQFDIATGACTLGPCIGQSLQPVSLVQSEGIVYAEVDSK